MAGTKDIKRDLLLQYAATMQRVWYDWLVTSEVRDWIIHVCGEIWGIVCMKGVRRQRGRGEAMDGERDAVAREQQPHRGPLKTTGLSNGVKRMVLIFYQVAVGDKWAASSERFGYSKKGLNWYLGVEEDGLKVLGATGREKRERERDSEGEITMPEQMQSD